MLLTVTGPVPKWATAAHKDRSRVQTRQEFEEFMTAVGRHYGSGGVAVGDLERAQHPRLPAARSSSQGTPDSPRIYRGLFQAGYAGLQAAGIASPKVLIGETAPFGRNGQPAAKASKSRRRSRFCAARCA